MRASKKLEAVWDKLAARYSREFMKPTLYYGPYVVTENGHGENRLWPKDCAALRRKDERIVERRTGYYARLSASGCMDSTEYTEIACIGDVREFFDMWPGLGDE